MRILPKHNECLWYVSFKLLPMCREALMMYLLRA